MHNVKKPGQRILFTSLLVILFALTAVVAGCSHGKKKDASVTDAVLEQSVTEESVLSEDALNEGLMTDEELLTAEAKRSGALETIYYDFDKHTLTAEAKASLDKTAQWLSSKPGTRILIEGHCDEWGTNEYNVVLGDRRATSARDYLVSVGVVPELITTLSYGEERPADQGHNEEAWAKNRRAEFKAGK